MPQTPRPALAGLFVLALLLAAGCARVGDDGAGWTYGPTSAPEASVGASGGATGASGAATGAPGEASPGGTPMPPAPSASGSAAASPGAAASAGTARIEVRLTDALRIEPATISVPAGVLVTFVVTNTGALAHEFFVGDEAAQQAHGQALTGATTAPPDTATGIGLAPGETKDLTMTFPAGGSSLAGCHVAGHYLAGMKAAITVR